MKKKIIFDMFLNIVASAIPVLVLQLVLLPALSVDMSEDSYGLLITILSLLNVVPATMGNSLNNIRLIYGDESSSKGDYHLLLVLLGGLNVIAVAVGLCYFHAEMAWVDMLLTILVSAVWLAREYYIVAFRIRIDYTAMVVSNLLMVVGYGVGYFAYRCTKQWQYIYLIGNLISLMYVFSKCDLWREPIRLTKQFRKLGEKTGLLLCSNTLTRITTYADKMLIYPILGGATVSVYYAATLFGKVVAMVITPASTVLLSYLTKKTKRDNQTFKITFFTSACVCVMGYCVCIVISRPILTLLYPQYVEKAMQYIFITTGTIVLNTMISVVHPFVLKFFDMKWQVAINGCYVVAYLLLTMGLLSVGGLYGFCMGTFLAMLLKLLFMLCVYLKCEEKSGSKL